MKLLADAHIARRTVDFLRALGHDVVRVADCLPAAAADASIVELARQEVRVIVTQDLDFSALIALSGHRLPSLISLRLSSARVEHVNDTLARVLPQVEEAVTAGAIVTVEDQRVRVRSLPLAP